MSYLYVNDNGVTVGVEANRCVAKYPDGMVKYVPIESLEGIVIMGQSQLTTRCTEECLKRGINISYFSKGGRYFGRLQSTGHVKAERQRQQCSLYDTEFSVELAKKNDFGKIKKSKCSVKKI